MDLFEKVIVKFKEHYLYKQQIEQNNTIIALNYIYIVN